MSGQEFCLRWSEYSGQVSSLLSELQRDEELVDVTLCCAGRSVRAHRLMLSAASPYFRHLMRATSVHQSVMVFLKDVQFDDLLSVLEFVYTGQVSITHGRMARFVQTAEMLQIRGLSADTTQSTTTESESASSASQLIPPRKRCRSSCSASPLPSPGNTSRTAYLQPTVKASPPCRIPSRPPPSSPPRSSGVLTRPVFDTPPPSACLVQVKRPASPASASPSLDRIIKQERHLSPPSSPLPSDAERVPTSHCLSQPTTLHSTAVPMHTVSPVVTDGASENLTLSPACTDTLSTVTEASAPLRHLSSFVKNWR